MMLMKTTSMKKNQKQHISQVLFDKSISDEINLFKILQKLFIKLIFLVHFDSDQHLYINVNTFKQYSFDTVIYYIDDDSDDTEFS